MYDLDDVALLDAPTTDPAFRAIQALSHQIAPLRQRVNAELDNLVHNASNADAPYIDFDRMAADAEELERLHAELVAQIDTYNATNPDAQLKARLDTWRGFAGEWARATLFGIPEGVGKVVDAVTGEVVDLAKRVTDALAAILRNTTGSVFSGLTPLFLGVVGLGVLAFLAVRKAETTRTYRHYVA